MLPANIKQEIYPTIGMPNKTQDRNISSSNDYTISSGIEEPVNPSPIYSYRKELDGLRAIAVIAVIINHFDKQLLPFGYLGVDMFFAISGFVITLSISKSSSASHSFQPFAKEFYAKRILRLAPALAVMVLCTSILICLFDPNPAQSIWTGAFSLLGVSNLYLNHLSTDYWAASTELNPFTHTWSLGVEEQFYLVFPVAAWFLLKKNRQGKQLPTSAQWLAVSAGIVTSSILFINAYRINANLAYFLPQFRAWELLAGVATFLITRHLFDNKTAARLARIFRSKPILLPAQIISLIFIINILLSHSPEPIQNTFSLIAFTCLFILSTAIGGPAATLLSAQAATWIGILSYSLYLWHWPIIALFKWTIGMSWWSIIIQALLITGVAVLSYKYIETSIRYSAKYRKKLLNNFTRFMAISASAPFILGWLLISISGYVYAASNKGSNFKLQFEEKEWPGGIKVSYRVLQNSWFSDANKDLHDFTHCHRAGTINHQLGAECLLKTKHPKEKLSHNSESSAQAIALPKSSQRNRIFILGDSHATNFAYGIGKAFSHEFDVSQFTIGHGCSYIEKAKSDKVIGTNCNDYRKTVDKIIDKDISKGDAIALAMTFDHYGSEETKALVLDLAKRVSVKQAYFLLFDDVPDLADPIQCISAWYRPFKPEDCSKTLDQVNSDFKQMDQFGKLISKMPNAHYIPIRQIFCDKNNCSHTLKDQLIYFNKGHLTIGASRNASESIKEISKNFTNQRTQDLNQ